MLDRIGLPSLFDSFLSSIDLLLGHICISIIRPKSVRSEVLPCPIFPSSEWYIGDGSTFVIERNIHNLSVLFVAQCFIFKNGEFLLLEIMEGPLRANSDDVILLAFAYILFIIIRDHASFEISYLSFTESRDNGPHLQLECPCHLPGVRFELESLIIERIIVAGIMMVEVR